MYKCYNCCNMFEEGEEKEYFEPIGECWGESVCVRRLGCPHCNGDFFEAFPCKICGRYKCREKGETCEICEEEVKNRYTKLIEENFNDAERELIDKFIEDGEI